jgi:hypothetical protein
VLVGSSVGVIGKLGAVADGVATAAETTATPVAGSVGVEALGDGGSPSIPATLATAVSVSMVANSSFGLSENHRPMAPPTISTTEIRAINHLPNPSRGDGDSAAVSGFPQWPQKSAPLLTGFPQCGQYIRFPSARSPGEQLKSQIHGLGKDGNAR